MKTESVRENPDNMRKQWDGLAEQYGVEVLAQKCILLPSIVRHYLPHISAESRVLDIGCGDGMYTDLIGKQTGATVVGVDLSPQMIVKAQTKYPDGEFKVGRIEDLEGNFDHIFANMLLCNIPKQQLESFFSSARKLLQKGGYLTFTNVSPDFQKSCRTAYLTHNYPSTVTEGSRIQVELYTANGHMIGPFQNYHYSADFLTTLLHHQGFRCLEMIDLSSEEETAQTPTYRLFRCVVL